MVFNDNDRVNRLKPFFTHYVSDNVYRESR